MKDWNLSPRERDVMEATLKNPGLTTKEIAPTLGISHKTVEVHWENIMNKMGVCSRVHALLLWDRENREGAAPPVKAPAGWAHCMYCDGRGFLRSDKA